MKILYFTHGDMHPDKDTQKEVFNNLSTLLDGKDIEILQKDMDEIENINLESYNVLILFFHIVQNDNATVNRIQSYVENGGVVIGIHGVGASYKGNNDWFEIIGGRFKMHPPVCEFQVECGKYKANITDELYVMDLKANIESHAFSYHDDKKIPCLWRKKYRKGKVVYLALGHELTSVKSEIFSVAFKKALELGGLFKEI